MPSSPTLRQFHDPDLSLWQSAVDEAISADQAVPHVVAPSADAAATVETPRPDLSDPRVRSAALAADAVAADAHVEPAVAPPDDAAARGEPRLTSPLAATDAFGSALDVARFCATSALRLANGKVMAAVTGDNSGVTRFEEEIGTKFDLCDIRWARSVENYVRFKLERGRIPYRVHTDGNPFVIEDGRLPANARIAIVGDWGTGEPAAARVLAKIATYQPHVVFHLGDIYYSGTTHEVQRYFYAPWRKALGLPRVAWGASRPPGSAGPATFTLSGNHEMYSGGAAYYTLIDMLGQPASYFCLRNDHWQFLALDTGFYDSNPLGGTLNHRATQLHDTEAAWLHARIAEAGSRKSFLLSHHQLFSATERFDGGNTNERLLAQVSDVLPKTTAWFWGHEHSAVVYDRFPAGPNGVLGRCLGHGAFPVGVDEPCARDPGVPITVGARPLEPDLNRAFRHGFALLDLDDGTHTAHARYFQYDTEQPEQEPEILDEEDL